MISLQLDLPDPAFEPLFMRSIFDVNSWLINTLGFSNGLWVLIGAILFALLCLFFVLTVRDGRVKTRNVLLEALWTALWYYGAYAAGHYLAFGERALWHPGKPLLVWVLAAAVLLVAFTWYFLRRKKRSADRVSAYSIRRSAAGSGAAKFCFSLWFGALLLMAVISGLRVGCGDSILHLIVPMCLSVLTLLLVLLTRWRFWFVLGALLLAVYAVLMVQNVLTFPARAYGQALALVPLYLSCILPMLFLAFNGRR